MHNMYIMLHITVPYICYILRLFTDGMNPSPEPKTSSKQVFLLYVS